MALSALLAVAVVGPTEAADTSTDQPLIDVAAGTGCQNGWRHVSLPTPEHSSRAYDVVVRDGELAWLLGGSDGSPLILRREGDGWKSVKAVPANAEADAPVALLDASVRPNGSLWTAGYVRPSRGVMRPHAGILNDRRWRDRSAPDPAAARVALAGVAAKGDERAWAVGTRLAKGRTRAYALRWDGQAWERRDPSLVARESGLTAVETTPGGTVWTVGWFARASGAKRPLVMRLEGGEWQRAPVKGVPAGIAVFTDVTFEGDASGWASGYVVAAGTSRHQPLVARWDGQAWTASVVPVEDGVSVIPRAIATDADGSIWLAGSSLLPDAGDPRAFVAHGRDGSAGEWTVFEDVPLPDGRSEAFSVAVAASTVYAAGFVGGQAFLLERCEADADGSDAEAEAVADANAVATTADAVANDADAVATTADAVANDADAVATTTAASADASGGTMSVAAELRLPVPVQPKGFRLRDISARAGLDLRIHTLAGMAADLDADGYEDLLVWSHGDPPHLLMGGPDGFSERDDPAFGNIDRHQCSAADVDADGALDVFCSVGRARGSAIDRHELVLRAGHPDASAAIDLLGIEDPFGRGRAATFIDLDTDGRPDLFVANSPDRGDAMPGTNRVFRNVGGRFAAAPEFGLDTSVGGWCAVAADIDRDGDEDLLVCQELSDDGREPGLRVHRNDDGTLRERSQRLGLEPIEDVEVIVADMTGDGRPDVVQLSRSRVRVNRADKAGEFKPVFEARTPQATGMAVGDADGDGSLDIYIVAGANDDNRDDLLLVNGGKGRSFTSVRIPQAKSGSGADVLAIDHDGNGLSDFVVLDGRGSVLGPVRLLASYPSS